MITCSIGIATKGGSDWVGMCVYCILTALFKIIEFVIIAMLFKK
jgi:hypothetical protein